LNSIGVTAALLKYRVPGRPGRPNYAAPLQDAQRALGLVRSRAGEWGLETNRIGILGFSAGGHLSALASASFDKRTYDPIDAADQASCRPDFTVLIYPAYLAEKNNTDKVAPEVAPGAHMPPTFIAQTEDDSVGVDKTMTYAVALQKAKTPFELHIYPVGGHGYGLRPNGMAVTTWPKRAEEWMRSRGILGAN